MDENGRIAALESRAQTSPEDVDMRVLCRYLASDEAETSRRAIHVRDSILENATSPDSFIDDLLALLDDPDDPSRRAAVETLHRFSRVWPDAVVDALVPEIESEDHRRRAAAVDILGRTEVGAVVPHAKALIQSIDDGDPRVAARAVAAVSSLSDLFPDVAAAAVRPSRRFLEEARMPPEGEPQLVYTRGKTGDGDKPLTNHLPNPYTKTCSLLETVARSHPSALDQVVGRLRELVVDPPGDRRVDLPTVLRILTLVARADPSAVEPIMPAVERHANTRDRRRRVAARNLLDERGRSIERPDPVTIPTEMATRDGTVQDAERLLSDIDLKAMDGEVDIETFLELLTDSDSAVRDKAAWGLECGTCEAYIDEIHARAPTFLAMFDEPHDCTRTHLRRLISMVVAEYPEEWTPALLALTDSEDPMVREMALGTLARGAKEYPALVAREHEVVTHRLEDEPAVTSAAFEVCQHLTGIAPEAMAPLAPTAVEATGTPEARIQAVEFLESLARSNPAAVTVHADAICQLVTDLADADTIHDRSRWQPSGSPEFTDEDQVLKLSLRVSCHLARDSPSAVAPIRPHAERVVEGSYFGKKPARALLAALERH